MEWYALYIDGELQNIRKWFGIPTVRDFGVAELPYTKYEVLIVPKVEGNLMIGVRSES